MKRRLLSLFGVIGLAALGASMASAQDKTVRSIAGDKWVITAEAGGVNYVEGGVSVVRLAGKSGRLLKGDSVDVGDRIMTDADGRAEILLNPGSFARLAGDSEFEFKTTALEELRLQVNKGSAIFEVFATNDFQVMVEAPRGKYNLIESGVYRVDVLPDGTSKLEVWKGKAKIDDLTVKGGRTVTAGGEDVAAVKFDRDERDDFELWSRSRAKELAKSNSVLKNRDMRTALMRSFLGGRWNTYDSFGLWVYNAQFGRYCFLPFGFGWSSPYGYGYGADIWWYRLPSTIFMPPVRTGTTTTGGTPPVSGTPPTNQAPTRRNTSDERRRMRERPPFAEVQGGRSTGTRTFGGDASSGSRSSRGVFTPGSQSSPMESRPASSPSPRMDPVDVPAPSRGSGPIYTKGRPIDR